MKRIKLPFSHQMIRGSIGKKFVIKQYDYGIVKTKFPDMTGIVATEAQRKCRNDFKKAVSFAKAILHDPFMKRKWQQKLKVKRRLFNAILKYYLQQLIKVEEVAVLPVERKPCDGIPGMIYNLNKLYALVTICDE